MVESKSAYRDGSEKHSRAIQEKKPIQRRERLATTTTETGEGVCVLDCALRQQATVKPTINA